MDRIEALYRIAEEISGKPAELRRSVHQARARPLLDDLCHWMEKTLGLLSTKSETAGTIRYALSRWRALTRYVDDGLLEIDNNAAEPAFYLRTVLAAIAEHPINRIQDLLPWNIAASLQVNSSRAA
jgi:hypothetical protein